MRLMAPTDVELDGCNIDFTAEPPTPDDEVTALRDRYIAELRALADG